MSPPVGVWPTSCRQCTFCWQWKSWKAHSLSASGCCWGCLDPSAGSRGNRHAPQRCSSFVGPRNGWWRRGWGHFGPLPLKLWSYGAETCGISGFQNKQCCKVKLKSGLFKATLQGCLSQKLLIAGDDGRWQRWREIGIKQIKLKDGGIRVGTGRDVKLQRRRITWDFVLV